MRKTERLGFGLSMLVTTAVVVAGCGSGGAASPSPAATPAEPAATSEATPEAVTIGFVGYNASVPATQVPIDAATQLMKDQGWAVLNIDPQGDVAKANSACVNFTARGVTAVIIPIFNADQMGQCTNAAIAAKIPYFYFSGTLGSGAQGAINGILAEPLNNLFMDTYSGNAGVQILALGLTAATPCRVRYEDFSAKWKAAGNPESQVDFQDMDIKIGSLVDGRTKTQQWLTAHPAAAGQQLVIWACSGGGATGAVSAMLDSKRTDIPVYTWDFTEQESLYVKEGYVAATAWPDTDKLGEALVDMLTGYFETGLPQGDVEAPYVIITPDTYDEFVASHPNAVPKP